MRLLDQVDQRGVLVGVAVAKGAGELRVQLGRVLVALGKELVVLFKHVVARADGVHLRACGKRGEQLRSR